MEIRGVKSWLEKGKMHTVDDDVLGIVQQIKQFSDRLHVFHNDQSGEFDVVESCLDGTDRLVFSVAELDMRVVHRLMVADQWRGREDPTHVLGEHEDFLVKLDSENDDLMEEKREPLRDRIREAGERFAWSLDICKDHHSVGGSIGVSRSVNGTDD